MQRASAAFGFLIFVLWMGVLAVGLAYVTVWATTRRRPQWRILTWLSDHEPPRKLATAEVIPFDRHSVERRRKQV